MRIITKIGALLAILALGACASTAPAPAAPAAHNAAAILPWQNLQEPLFEPLATRLLAENLDIKIALSRIAEARAAVGAAQADFYPKLNATASAQRSNVNSAELVNIGRAGFDASWEIDLFGRIRAESYAANAKLVAQNANWQDVQRIMLADLALQLLQWRQAQQISRETEQLLQAQSQQVSLLASRAKAGLLDRSFVERAQAQLKQTSTQLPLARAQALQAQYRIEIMLNDKDDFVAKTLAASDAGNLSVPKAEAILQVNMQSLAQRPDLRAAAADMDAQNANLAAARANFWPQLNLASFYGVHNVNSSPMAAANPIWSLLGAITLPLFQGGQLQAAAAIADAQSQQAALRYQQLAIQAVAEVKTALADYLQGINAAQEQAESLKHRKAAVSMAHERFKRGLNDMTDLTTAQAELDLATIELINKQAAAIQAYIRLLKALGGTSA